jgi:hypothetical protein
MKVTVAKWKKQISLLDDETAAVISKLEEVIRTRSARKELVSSLAE